MTGDLVVWRQKKAHADLVDCVSAVSWREGIYCGGTASGSRSDGEAPDVRLFSNGYRTIT